MKRLFNWFLRKKYRTRYIPIADKNGKLTEYGYYAVQKEIGRISSNTK